MTILLSGTHSVPFNEAVRNKKLAESPRADLRRRVGLHWAWQRLTGGSIAPCCP